MRASTCFRKYSLTAIKTCLYSYCTCRDSFNNLNETRLGNCYLATIRLIEDMDQ